MGASDVVFLSGYGIDIRVKRGRLCMEDGIAEDRRVLQLSRADRDVRRVVIHGHTGTVTLDAFRWMNDCEISFVHIDSDGLLLAASVPEAMHRPRVMRAQVLALENGYAVDLMRDVFRQKFQSALDVASYLDAPDGIIDRIREQIDLLERSRTLEQMASLEAHAGAAYWSAWEGFTLSFAKGERVPAHWRVIRGGRRGLKGWRNDRATDPLNAMLNYLYTVLEAETALACHAVGLEPRIGWMHTDRRWRASLALDLMEAVRHQVDWWVLRFLEAEELTGEDFFELRNGVCRVMPPMARVLSETGPSWQDVVYPLARSIAEKLSSVGLAASRVKRRPGYEEAQRPPRIRPLRKLDGRRGRSGPYRGRRVL